MNYRDISIAPEVKSADLYIAEYSPKDMRLISNAVRISTPDYEWEYSVGAAKARTERPH